jgi:hypothetical protein
MKMKHEISGGSGSDEEKLSQLEKQLMEAKMRLYDVKLLILNPFCRSLIFFNHIISG